MEYIKLFEEFTHNMFLFSNDKLEKSIPSTLEINYEGKKIKYEKNSVIPSDTKISIYYNKPEKNSKTISSDLYDSIAPEFLILTLLIKTESVNQQDYFDTRKVIYLEITDNNSPMLNMKIVEDGKINHIINKKVDLTKKAKSGIVKLIKSFDVSIKEKDI